MIRCRRVTHQRCLLIGHRMFPDSGLAYHEIPCIAIVMLLQQHSKGVDALGLDIIRFPETQGTPSLVGCCTKLGVHLHWAGVLSVGDSLTQAS